MKTIKEILESDNTDIVQDRKFLEVPCKESSLIEGEEIAAKLFRVLSDRGDGYGLAANQIGIQSRVCVINVKSPIYLVNPRIIESSGDLIYYESCLSFPNKMVRTKRFETFVVECDNIKGQLYFDVSSIPQSDRNMDNLDVIESVVVQHEISHLDGKTMFDFEDKQIPIKKPKSYGRNDKIMISDGTNSLTIKYKQFEPYQKKGYVIVNG